ncbi:MAG: hemerythrin family protein [Magnetococcales bacterium]|nr:hemerythrin family protein [Magnetococcales bacterium]
MSMINIEWSEELSVGVEAIDADHRKLVSLVNELFSAFFIGVGDEAVGAILTEVIDYTRHHFAREEALLNRLGSSDLAYHAEEHRQLTEQVLAISCQGASALSEDVLLFLREWLAHHIMGTDRSSFLPYRSV